MTEQNHNPMRDIDFLDGTEKSTAPLLATLHGFRSMVQTHLGIKKFPLVFDDDPKGAVKRAYGGDSSYPYGFWRISSINIDDETQAVQMIKKAGSGFSMQDLENAVINKAFLFRTNIEVDCYYLNNDPKETLAFVERLMIVAATRMMTFEITLPDGTEWTVTPYANQKGASIPQASKEDEGKPSTLEVNFSFRLSTKSGIIKPVAKINNDGNIQVNRNVGSPPE